MSITSLANRSNKTTHSQIWAQLSGQRLEGMYNNPSIAWPCKFDQANCNLSSTLMTCFVDHGEDYCRLGSLLVGSSPSGLVIDLRLFKEVLF